MAADIIGTGVTQSGSGSQTASITIPAGANAVVFGIASYLSGQFVTALNFDNGGSVDFTLAYFENVGSTRNQEVWYMTDADPNWPGTGAQTIYYNIPSGTDSGPWISTHSIEGVDTASPIGDIDSQEAGNTLHTFSLPNAVADDLVFGFSSGYNQIDNHALGAQTELAQTTDFNSVLCSCGYLQGSTSYQVEATGQTTYITRGANVFKGSAPSAGIPIDINGNQATDVNIDGNAVSAIYLGSTQLWP